MRRLILCSLALIILHTVTGCHGCRRHLRCCGGGGFVETSCSSCSAGTIPQTEPPRVMPGAGETTAELEIPETIEVVSY